MDAADDLLTDATLLARLGRWDEALDRLRVRYAGGDRDPRAARLYARLLAARGALSDAAEVYRSLATGSSIDRDVVLEFADVLWALDAHAEAETRLRSALGTDQDGAIAARLGRVLVALARPAEAVAFLRDAVGSGDGETTYSETWRWLVQALAKTDLEDAKRLLRRVDSASCRDPAAVLGLAVLTNEVDDPGLSEQWARAAIARAPDQGVAHFVLGLALDKLQRRDEALDALLRACGLMSNAREVLGVTVSVALSIERVEAVAEQAELLARHADATRTDLLFASLASWRLGRRDAAAELAKRAMAAGPADGMIEDVLIAAMLDDADADAILPIAESYAAKALVDDDALRRYAFRSLYLADWRARDEIRSRFAAAFDGWLAAGQGDCNMLWSLAGLGFDYGADLKVCRQVAARYRVVAPAMPSRVPREKIRVGWLQVATGFHSTQMATVNLLERCDRSRFEFYGYSRRDQVFAPGHVNQAFQEKLRGQFQVFRDFTPLTDDDAAASMRADDLDILIELQGLNEKNSMGILARRPARVTAVYYGFSHSTGANYVDYLLADRTFLPPELAAIGTEKIVYLPGCHMAPTLGDFHPAALTRAQVGLPDAAIVLCNFNNPWKHDPRSFASWMRILREVPGAVLWLARWNAYSAGNLRREAESAGVDPARLIFGRVESHPLHLKRLQLADLALNSFFVGGGVTSLDTLWAGVPMISTRGMARAPSAYLGASMLSAAGLGDLIVDDPASYEELAIALCRDPVRRAAYRRHLTENRSRLPLFDIAAAARHIDRACVLMFENWAAGRAPRELAVEPMWTRDRG